MLSFFGGEKEKARLVTASRNLYDCVYVFVSSSNTIFRMFNQFLKTELPIVTVRENLSIKENLQLLTSALREMQEIVELKNKDIQQKISHPLYSKITTPGSSADDKIRLVRDISVQYKEDFDNICGPVTVVLMKHSDLPEKLETAVRNLSSTPVLALRVGDLLMTYDEIAKALPDTSPTSSATAAPPDPRPRSQSIGTTTFSFTNFMRVILRGQSSKKNAIEVAADCLEEAIKTLKPACESFRRTIKTVEEYATLIIDKLQ